MLRMISRGTYWRTIRHLRRRQILARLWRVVPRAAISAHPSLPLRASRGWSGDIRRPGPIRRNKSFRFLNRSYSVIMAADWNNHEQSKLWLYHLHYFEWLREAAASERVAEDAAWLDRWIAENPVGCGAAWEPYPVSLRIVNWVIWLLTFGRGTRYHFDSLARQARYLVHSIEYHLGGNHLLANAIALVFAGTFFEGAEADNWRAYGLGLLGDELNEQILSDGAHFELSPMYHSLILEQVLDLLGLSCAYPHVLAESIAAMGLPEIASRMGRWLANIRHPDGEIPYFNDATVGIASPPERLLSYAARRKIIVRRSDERLILMRPSGFAILSRPPFRVIFDCGRIGPDYLPAHAHADTLSFELSVGRDRLISNSGTSTYEPGSERDWERSTSAHASVEIDGVSSAEIWASFRVGRRPHLVPVEFGADRSHDWVEASHDGFRHLPGKPIHWRRVTATAQRVCIYDRIEGRGVHDARGIFPVHPGVAVDRLTENSFRLTSPSNHTVDVAIDGPVETTVQAGRIAVAFGATVPRPSIEWRWHGSLPLSVETRLGTEEDPQGHGGSDIIRCPPT
jgi:uncharacterized heparinase superfamily protein